MKKLYSVSRSYKEAAESQYQQIRDLVLAHKPDTEIVKVINHKTSVRVNITEPEAALLKRCLKDQAIVTTVTKGHFPGEFHIVPVKE